jgi:A/G-specific adenine glycosylase
LHRSAADAQKLAALLVGWYEGVARDLPWRREVTPYRVLLSELMLQQTRVDTVVPYFERFVARWPTLGSLATASDDEVLSAWSGLGYYARARNLLRCARAVGGGDLPCTVEGLRALPGIGPYTAGAVASIGFGVAAPLVDGNVERVLSRLDARTAAPKGAGRAALWARAGEIVRARPDGAHPGALNQALMELGATVCTPRAPRCGQCPVAEHCLALAAGAPGSFPTRAPKAAPRPMRGTRVLARDGEHRMLLGRRPPGLLGGLWEPVGCDWDGDAPAGPDRLVDAVRERTGLSLTRLAPLGEVTHVFTHRRLVCAVWGGEAAGEPAPLAHYTEVRWVRPDEVPLSTLSRRVMALEARGAALELPFAAEPQAGSGWAGSR